MFSNRKEIDANRKSIEEVKEEVVLIKKDIDVLYRVLSESKDLLKELRKEIHDAIKKRTEPNDLVIYNLKNGLSPHLPLLDTLPKDIEDAKGRMAAYRRMYESRLKDMEAFQKERDEEKIR